MTHPITQSYFREIQLKIKEGYLELGEGRSIDMNNPNYTIQATNKIVGKIEAYKDVLDIELVKE